jgi:DNA-binding CsgD family transcriptional regulator/PAS domain-containing protein
VTGPASGVDPAPPSPWNEVAERSDMPVLLVALSTRRVVARSNAAEALVGPIEWAYDLTGDREQSRKRLDLLANGVINGYHFTSTLTTPSGSPVQLEVDVQRINDAEGRDLALVLLAPGDEAHEGERADALVTLRSNCSPAELDAPLLVGTVDQDWRIERLSSDVKKVIGYEPKAIIGTPFTHWVHPGDVANLLIGIGRALEDDAAVTVRVRVQHADKSWCPMVVAIIPLTGSKPAPEFAFIVRPVDEADISVAEGSGNSSDRIAALEHRLRRIAIELEAAGIAQRVRRLPDLTRLPEVNELSTRQLEVLTRLLDGQRVSTIAAEMFVSPSTIRNHLAAIYRKFGVHSQAELLAFVRGHP